MKRIVIWLYSYMAMHMGHMLHHMLAMLDAMRPDPVPRPALQHVRTPASPSLNDIRFRSDFLMPWI